MGLDSVELIMAVEEEFGIDIPDHDAEKMVTVGEMYEWLNARIASADPVSCLTQRIFYKLRKALVENYGIDRSRIGPDTRMTDLLPLNVIEDGWPFLQMFIDAKTPPFRVAIELLGLRLSEQTLTMRQLVDCLIEVNGRFLPPQRDSADQIWQRLVAVIVRQQNVRIEEVKPEARFGRDLGID